MFEHLKTHKKIIVTGPQRSGTRICAKMIAHDTGHRFIDETEVSCFNLDKIEDIIKYDSEFVLQCPCLAHLAPNYSDVLFVFMRRDLNDIQNSIFRICGNEDLKAPKRKIFGEATEKAELKYARLEKNRPFIRNLLEVDYASLSEHPLWVSKESRENFTWNQTYENQFNDSNKRKILCNI